jgi:hypothetical protein
MLLFIEVLASLHVALRNKVLHKKLKFPAKLFLKFLTQFSHLFYHLDNPFFRHSLEDFLNLDLGNSSFIGVYMIWCSKQ